MELCGSMLQLPKKIHLLPTGQKYFQSIITVIGFLKDCNYYILNKVWTLPNRLHNEQSLTALQRDLTRYRLFDFSSLGPNTSFLFYIVCDPAKPMFYMKQKNSLHSKGNISHIFFKLPKQNT